MPSDREKIKKLMGSVRPRIQTRNSSPGKEPPPPNNPNFDAALFELCKRALAGDAGAVRACLAAAARRAKKDKGNA